MNSDMEKVKQYFDGREVELPFVRPVDAAQMYHEDSGDFFTVRTRQDLPSIDVIDYAERKTGTRNWLVVLGFPVHKNGCYEWRLKYDGIYPRKENR